MRLAFVTLAVGALVALTLPSKLIAQELTLDDCIERALQTRASIIAAMGREKAAASGKRAALGAFLPRVSASYSYSKGKDTDIKSEQEIFTAWDTVTWDATITPGDTIVEVNNAVNFRSPEVVEVQFPDQDRTSKNLNFSARMALFDPATWFDYAAARANHAAANLNIIATEQDLIYAVKLSYFAYLASVENVTVQEEAVKRADEQLKLIQSRFDLGSASKSDVLKQKVQFGNDRLALLRAQNSVTNTKASLAYTIGVDPREEWRFSTDYNFREYPGTLDEAIEFGLNHEPSLLAADKSVSSASAYLKSARMDYLPTVSGFASWDFSDGTRGDTALFDQSSRSRTYGLTVSYNIFDGFLREDRVTLNKVALNDRKAELADARNLAVSKIKTAYLDIEQLREQKTVSEENVDAATEDLRITQEKYNLGAATILDLLDAQVSLKTAQVSLIQADFDLNLAIAQLENAMGKM